MTKPKKNLVKLAAEITARGGRVDGQGVLHMPLSGGQKMTGFDGKPLKTSTPKTVQEAADYMFDKKSALESTKNAFESAMGKLEAEMAALSLKEAVVRDGHGYPYTVKFKAGKTKLEVKAIK